MSNKLIIALNIDYGKSKKGDELEMDYLEARNLVNSGGAKLVCYADERKAKDDKEKQSQNANLQTKEDKQGAKTKVK